MCNAAMHQAFFELGRLSARPFVVNQDLLREITKLMGGVVRADIVGAAVWDNGHADRMTQCHLIGPGVEPNTTSEASNWDFGNDTLIRELATQDRGRICRRDDLIDSESFRISALYKKFQKPRGLGDQALCMFTRNDGADIVLSIHNLERSGAISDSALRALGEIAPIIANTWAAKWRAEPTWLVNLNAHGRSVLELVLMGLDDDQISQRTGLTYHSVRAHLKRLFRDAGVRSRLHLMQSCRRTAPTRVTLITQVRSTNPDSGMVCVA